MGKSAGGTSLLASWKRFMSDRPEKLALRVRLLIFLDIIVAVLAAVSLRAPWFKQEWRVANGEILSWVLCLSTAEFRVDCSSDSPEFLELCKLLYGHLAGDLRTIARFICNAGEKVRDTDLQALLQETCGDVKLIEKLSIATGIAGGMCVCLMIFGIIAFLLHVGSGFRNRKAWRGAFWCHIASWTTMTTSCVLYTIATVTIEDLFHVQPSLNVAFDPAQAEPVRHELLYGFITAIATAGLLAVYLPFWWKAAPFDPDPYFMEPQDLRRALEK